MRNKYLDLEGNVVERDPDSFPYSYDPYVIYKSPEHKKDDICYYHDRIVQCYYTNEEIESAKKSLGIEYVHWKDPLEVGKFLSILMSKQLIVTAITEGANYGTGYPYWIIYVQDK